MKSSMLSLTAAFVLAAQSLMFSFAHGQEAAPSDTLGNTEELAAKVLSITVGVEVVGQENVSQTPTNPNNAAPQNPNVSEAQQQQPTPTSAVTEGLSATLALNAFANQQQQQSPKIQVASGTIVGDGTLVISAGLTAEPTDEIRVTLPNGQTIKAVLIARDGASLISLCRLQNHQASALPISTEEVRTGQRIMSAQYAGEGDFAVRVGIVSAAERFANESLGPWIQLDIPAEVGAAGGPVVNQRGEVLGLVVATQSHAASASFAIPAREITQLVEQVSTTEKQRQDLIVIEKKVPWLGVQLSSDEQQPLKVEILENSPAAQAGLQNGDTLLAVDNRAIFTITQLQRLLRRYRVGDQIVIRYQRGENSPVDAQVQLGEMPKRDVAAANVQVTPWSNYILERGPNRNLILTYPNATANTIHGYEIHGYEMQLVPQMLYSPALTLSRSDQDQKLEQLSQQLSEIAKQLGALANEVQQLRAGQPINQPTPQQQPPQEPQPDQP